ncbi:golgin subfamily A member 6-like protein 22 [Palaemon carinicauda]|uniref:golgin subfamily A member 6-like protein 22 n=1 Tax=Palaemon carinicauda TaxID=392227 RepID=UPI0035B5AB5C
MFMVLVSGFCRTILRYCCDSLDGKYLFLRLLAFACGFLLLEEFASPDSNSEKRPETKTSRDLSETLDEAISVIDELELRVQIENLEKRVYAIENAMLKRELKLSEINVMHKELLPEKIWIGKAHQAMTKGKKLDTLEKLWLEDINKKWKKDDRRPAQKSQEDYFQSQPNNGLETNYNIWNSDFLNPKDIRKSESPIQEEDKPWEWSFFKQKNESIWNSDSPIQEEDKKWEWSFFKQKNESIWNSDSSIQEEGKKSDWSFLKKINDSKWKSESPIQEEDKKWEWSFLKQKNDSLWKSDSPIQEEDKKWEWSFLKQKNDSIRKFDSPIQEEDKKWKSKSPIQAEHKRGESNFLKQEKDKRPPNDDVITWPSFLVTRQKKRDDLVNIDEAMKNELSKIRRRNAELIKEKAELKNDVRALKKANSNFKWRMGSLMKHWENDKQLIRKQKDLLKQKRDDLINIDKTIKNEFSKIRRRNIKLIKEKADLNYDVMVLKKANSDLEWRMKSCMKHWENDKQVIRKLKEHIKHINEQKDNLESELKSRKQDFNRIKVKVAACESQMRHCEDILLKMGKENEAFKQQIEVLRKEREKRNEVLREKTKAQSHRSREEQFHRSSEIKELHQEMREQKEEINFLAQEYRRVLLLNEKLRRCMDECVCDKKRLEDYQTRLKEQLLTQESVLRITKQGYRNNS